MVQQRQQPGLVSLNVLYWMPLDPHHNPRALVDCGDMEQNRLAFKRPKVAIPSQPAHSV
jgi:hypothetical protein